MADMLNDEALKCLTELMDREKIRDCMLRYSQAADRLDYELMKEAFWPDARDSHGPFEGNAYEVFAEIFVFLRAHALRTHHFMGPSLIRMDGQTSAIAETYSQNFHVLKGDDGNYDFVHGTRYLDKMEKRGAEWRIMHRTVVIEWVVQGASSYDFSDGIQGSTSWLVSERRPDDVMYKLLGDIAREPLLDQ